MDGATSTPATRDAGAGDPAAGTAASPSTGAAISRGHRRAELDGVRGLSVGIVIVTHATGLIWATGILIDAFFVLSGFLLTGIALEDSARRGGRLSPARFYGLRVARLGPALAIMLVMTALLSALGGGNPGAVSTTEAITWTALLSANWLEVLEPGGLGFLDHMWFLAIEEQFYLVWPFLLGALLTLRKQVRWILLLIATVMVVRVVLVVTGTGERHELWSVLRFDTLLLGGAMAFVVTRPKRYAGFLRLCEKTWLALVLIVVFFGGAALLGTLTSDPLRWASFGLSSAFAACAGFGMLHLLVRPGGPASRFFASRPLVLLGRTSYGLYLFHYPLFVYATRFHDWSRPVTALFVAGTTVPLVLVVYYGVELPVMRRAVRSAGVRSAVPAHPSRAPEASTPVDAPPRQRRGPGRRPRPPAPVEEPRPVLSEGAP